MPQSICGEVGASARSQLPLAFEQTLEKCCATAARGSPLTPASIAITLGFDRLAKRPLHP
jgi:hypothetical protein